MTALPAQLTRDPALKSKLVKLARKRLERFVTLYPKALVSDEPEIVHDLRVASRRLQQALRVLPPHSKSVNRKLFKVLRRVRRAFGRLPQSRCLHRLDSSKTRSDDRGIDAPFLGRGATLA